MFCAIQLMRKEIHTHTLNNNERKKTETGNLKFKLNSRAKRPKQKNNKNNYKEWGRKTAWSRRARERKETGMRMCRVDSCRIMHILFSPVYTVQTVHIPIKFVHKKPLKPIILDTHPLTPAHIVFFSAILLLKSILKRCVVAVYCWLFV